MPKRRWWRRRTRQRQLGYALYAIAGLFLVIGAVVVINRDSGPSDAGTVGPTPTALRRTTAPTSAVGTTTPRAVDPAPGVNSAPVVRAPGTVTVARRGVSPVEGLAVDDVEAAANDEAIGVILYAPNGTIHIDRTAGLQVFQPNPGPWIPFIGRLSAINAALATVGYEPRTSGSRQQIEVLVSDFGGTAKQDPQASKKTVTVQVS